MLAMLVRTPELALEKDDAEKLAQGVHAVGRHYNWTAAQKTIDITNLCMVAAAIYGAKFMLIKNRIKAQTVTVKSNGNAGASVFSIKPDQVPGNSL